MNPNQIKSKSAQGRYVDSCISRSQQLILNNQPAFSSLELDEREAEHREVFLTSKEVALMLKVEVGTLAVWRCSKRMDLPYLKMGRAVRYRHQDVLGFMFKNAYLQNEEEM